MRPAIPAAASEWPIFAFTDPTSSGRLAVYLNSESQEWQSVRDPHRN
jgi:hypothetical protein